MAAKKAQKSQKGNLTFLWIRLRLDVMAAGHVGRLCRCRQAEA
jgi:hypothetical protein